MKHKIVDFPPEDPLKIEDLNQESILQSKNISSVVVLTDFNPQDKIKTESFNIKHIRVKCQYCDKLFNEQDLLIKHINNEHCHKCNLCNEEFISKDTLRIHISNLHFKCVFCDEIFDQKPLLTKHIDSDHKCKLCYKICSSLKKHNDTFHYDKSIKNNEQNIVLFPNQKIAYHKARTNARKFCFQKKN